MARPKPCGPGFCTGTSAGIACAQRSQNLPRPILASVVDDDDLVRNVAEAQFEVQVLDGRGDAALLVARRNDDRQLGERRQRRDRVAAASAMPLSAALEMSSQSGCCRAWLEDLVAECPRSFVSAASPSVRARARRRAPSRECRMAEPPGRFDRVVAEAVAHHALSCASERADCDAAADVDALAAGRGRSRPSADRSAARGPPGAGSRAPGGRGRRTRCSAAAAAQPAVDPVGEDALIRRARTVRRRRARRSG